MKPWVILAAALTGAVLSLMLRAAVYREAPAPTAIQVQHADIATSNWDKRIEWVTRISPSVTLAAEPALVTLIHEEQPLLYLQDSQGQRVIVGSYQLEGEWLTLSDIRESKPVQYKHIVAVYNARQETLLPVNVDLR